ncbi:hypothetical protein [Mesorhizobium sp.]|uniref:hypothetical protein n=1 Tax=Mesorhizobium sp. TaxID=1871066 RepID=UPI0025CC1EE4|nr:hypothetical protein [Mesorhizobium sp.]
MGETLPANWITSTIAGNAASQSTSAISGKSFGMNSRTMSRLNWTVDLRLFFRDAEQISRIEVR